MAWRRPDLKASGMRTFRRFQSALTRVLEARQRGLISILVALAAFGLGAWLPQDRIFGGTAVAGTAVALTQLLLYIADNRGKGEDSNEQVHTEGPASNGGCGSDEGEPDRQGQGSSASSLTST
ncbi:hypothetical protein ACH4YN_18270 [Streptomyces griseofuscus]|uniref:hypothetical protein n=1 Tax=Streptomyces griseofuscus TaxID=146922 RepID=UPI0037A366E0